MYRAPEYLIELCQEDYDIFVAVIEHPPEPNEKLKRLMRQPRCPFCGKPNGGQVHYVAGHAQTECCGQVTFGCCEGS